MASITTSDSELAHIVREYRGYCRSNNEDWIKHCTDEIKELFDVTKFVDSLPITCNKRSFILRWLAYDHGGHIDDLAWAKISLARARNRCCSCHETGSYRKSGMGA